MGNPNIPGIGLVEIASGSGATAARSFKSTVIAIADLGHRPSDWTDGNQCWLISLLPDILDEPLVLQLYDPSLVSDTASFKWQALFEAGDRLVDLLLERIKDDQFVERPIVFVAHGLGGFILKRAIGAIYERYHQPEFGQVINLLATIILLGCPHPTFDERHRWSKFPAILKANANVPKNVMKDASASVHTVANITKAFDESNHNIDVVSFIEGKPTRNKGPWFQRTVLVEEGLAKTRSKREKIVKVDLPYTELCHVASGSLFHKELSRCLERVRSFVVVKTRVNDISAPPESLPSWGIPDIGRDKDRLAIPKDNVYIDSNQAQVSSSGQSAFEMVPGKPIDGIEKEMKLPCFMMGPYSPLPEFAGRSQTMLEVEEALSPDNLATADSLRTFAICGAGGLGKTQIAVQYASQCKRRKLFDAIFWVPAGDDQKLANAFASMSVQLRLQDADTADDQTVSKSKVLEWLVNPARKVCQGSKLSTSRNETTPRWLLVFDSANMIELLRDYWPLGGKGSILITSRDPDAKTQARIPSTAGVDLEPFSVNEAAKLLNKMTGFEHAEDCGLATSIVGKLSCFPIAISQIARTISRRKMSLTEFLKDYNQDVVRRELNKVSISHITDKEGEHKTIATIWSLEDLPPSARSVFNLLSFLDADEIPETLLKNTMKKSQRKIVVPEYPQTENSYTIARGEIAASSLAHRNIRNNNLTTHVIIQDTNRLSLSDIQFEISFEFAVEVLYDEWPFSEFDYNLSRWPACEKLVSHIRCLHLIALDRACLHKELRVSVELSRLFMDMAWYQVERGRPDYAPPYLDHAESICNLVPASTMVTLTDIVYVRADLANKNRSPKEALVLAMKYHELAAKHDSSGWRLPQSHNTLCAVYLGTGDFAASVFHAEQATAGYASLATSEFVDWPYINKADAQRLLGKYDEAIEGLMEYFRLREIEGEDKYRTAVAKALLGSIYHAKGLYDSSIAVLIEALQLFSDTVGEDTDDTANAQTALGNSYHQIGENDLARDLYLKALKFRGDRVEDTAKCAQSYFRLSRIYECLQDTSNAGITRDRAEQLLLKLGTGLTEANLVDLLPAWDRD